MCCKVVTQTKKRKNNNLKIPNITFTFCWHIYISIANEILNGYSYIFVEWIFVVVVLVAVAESKRKIINNINSRKLRFFFFLSSSNDAWICCHCVHFTNPSNGSVIPRYLLYIFPGFERNCFCFLFVFVSFLFRWIGMCECLWKVK